MFAVPGFSSLKSASLKSSFNGPDVKGVTVNSTPQNGNDTAQSKNKKRKRSQPTEVKEITDISADSLGNLWSQYVEGKGSPTVDKGNDVQIIKSKKGKNKKRKLEGKNLDRTNSDTVNGELTHQNGDLNENAQRQDRIDEKVETANETKDKNKKKKKEKKDKKNHQINGDQKPIESSANSNVEENPAANDTINALAVSSASSQQPKLTPLQEKMRLKLSGARFRHLNQLLYTTPSAESTALFKAQPEMFTDYHAGFRQQVESWPENPVDIFIKRLFARGKLRDSGYRSGKHKGQNISSNNSNPLGTSGLSEGAELTPLPRAKDGFTTVVDLGCGEGAIAKAITSAKPRPKIKIQSFDLHSPNPLVTVADISNLPLRDGSVGVAVFCLALMGTNWLQMIEEAVRVLRTGGEVWIAEIKSRFARTKGPESNDQAGKDPKGKKGKGKKQSGKQVKDDTNPVDAFVEERDDEVDQNRWAAGEQQFIEALSKRGLRLKNRNGNNKMFVLLDFEKVGKYGQSSFSIPPKPDMHGRISKKFHVEDEAEIDEAAILQPCLYKLR